MTTWALPVDSQVTGELRMNGRGYSASELKKCAGYVMQDDLLNPNLTVGVLAWVCMGLHAARAEVHHQRDGPGNGWDGRDDMWG